MWLCIRLYALIGSYDGSLYCLSAKDGKVLWSLKTESYVHGTPSVDDTATSLLFAPQRFDRIDVARPARRQVARQHPDPDQHQGHGREHDRVSGLYVIE
jgi:hypothetical protein